ncbi:unnamed protein product, partial [Bubo scandiacus]
SRAYPPRMLTADAIIIILAFSNTLTLLNGIIDILSSFGNSSSNTCYTTPMMTRTPSSDIRLSGYAFTINFSSILMYEKAVQYNCPALLLFNSRRPRSQSWTLHFRGRGFTYSHYSGAQR